MYGILSSLPAETPFHQANVQRGVCYSMYNVFEELLSSTCVIHRHRCHPGRTVMPVVPLH